MTGWEHCEGVGRLQKYEFQTDEVFDKSMHFILGVACWFVNACMGQFSTWLLLG